MTLSDVAAREIAKVLRKHVGMKELEQVVTELVEIPGDKDFRDNIERLVHALRMVSDRSSAASPVGDQVPVLGSILVVVGPFKEFVRRLR